jgi:hypothetical protein
MINDYRDNVHATAAGGGGGGGGGGGRRGKKKGGGGGGNTRSANLKPFHTYWMLGGDMRPGKFPLINLKADRAIAKGEELLWDCAADAPAAVLLCSPFLLAAGCWLLAAGCWLLAAGCWLLAAACCVLFASCFLLGAV